MVPAIGGFAGRESEIGRIATARNPLRLDRVGVDVLEELEATVAVWRLEHGDVGVVAVEVDGGSVHSPLTVSRPRTVSPRSVKKAIVVSGSRTAMPTFSSLMGMRVARYRVAAICSGRRFPKSRKRNRYGREVGAVDLQRDGWPVTASGSPYGERQAVPHRGPPWLLLAARVDEGAVG